MPVFTDTLPQTVTPIRSITIRALVAVLPEEIEYPINVWISGKIARFGRTADNLIFLVEQEPTNELMQYFDSLVKPLGVDAAASDNWRNHRLSALKLYNSGRLIIDKTTMTFRELPSEIAEWPMLTVAEVLSKLPATIPWTQTMYLTGGLAKNGWSCNDGDVLVLDSIERSELAKIARFFTDLIGWHFDAGQRVMPEREPVYLFKLYEGGRRCH